MEGLEKIEVFKEELDAIKNKDIRRFTEKAISLLPDYFFTEKASSSEKYHPAYAREVGGLVMHTKAVARVAIGMFPLESTKTIDSDHKDLIITACLLHDGLKRGLKQQQHTTTLHPLTMVDFIMGTEELHEIISKEYIKYVCDNISTHMGQWNEDYNTHEEVLPVPHNTSQKFVHISDYIASRKFIIVDFNIPIKREDYEPKKK